MLFNRDLIISDSQGEKDWNEDKLLEEFPHLTYSARDDANQKMLDGAMTPEIFLKAAQFEADINLKIKGLVLSNIIILLFLVYLLKGVL